MFFVGVDVGGTNLKIGLIDNNRIVDREIIPTNTFDIVRQIINAVKDICDKNNIEVTALSGVGIGFPGLVINGKVVDSANIGLSDCQLNELVADELGVACVVRNDGEMATLAEHRFGSGKGCNNMLLLTVGTGIGGGIIINNQLYVGNGGAGELGHITLVKDGIPCGCGRSGCAEKYLSAIAVQDNTKEYFRDYPNSLLWQNMDNITISSILDAVDQGDECARLVVSEFVEHFADYLLGFCNIFRPEKILVGGGITHTPRIIEMVAKKCKEKDFGYKGSPEVDIEIASLGNDGGMLGTAVCFENALGIELTNSEEVQEPTNFDYVDVVDSQSTPALVDSPAEESQSQEPTITTNIFEHFVREQAPVNENGQVINTISSDYDVEDIDDDLPDSESDSLFAKLYGDGATEEQQTDNLAETQQSIENVQSVTNQPLDDTYNLQQPVVNPSEGDIQPFEINGGNNQQTIETYSHNPFETWQNGDGDAEIDPYDDNAEGMGNNNATQEQGVLTPEEMMARMNNNIDNQ